MLVITRSTDKDKVKGNVLIEPHGSIRQHWSPFLVALSQTPACTARPRIQG